MSTIRMNSDYQKKLLRKWAPMLECGEKIDDIQQKLVLAQVLENTRNEFVRKGLFTEAVAGDAQNNVGRIDGRGNAYDGVYPTDSSAGGVLTQNDYILPNVVMPMLRRIFPTLMAHELVGVQPMTGPVGFALALRAIPAGHGNDPDVEFGYGVRTPGGDIDPRIGQSQFTGMKGEAMRDQYGKNPAWRGGEDLDSFLNGYTGAFNGGRGLGTQAGEGEHTAFGYAENAAAGDAPYGCYTAGYNPEFGNFGNRTHPKATFTFKKEVVTAETRKLGSEWTPELAEDLEAMHGIDIETEMVNLVSYQIGAEIDDQIKRAMLGASWADAVTLNVANLDGLDQMGRIAAMLTFVTKCANEIAISTRRGAGNFVVASTSIASALQQLGTTKLVSDGKSLPSIPASAVGTMNKEGLINDGRQLLVRDTQTVSDYAVVGYKGTHPGDSGIIYCPYIPVTLYKAIKPENGISVIGARTRYGLLNNPFDAKNFYKFIKFEGFTTGYSFSTSNRTFWGTPADETSTPSA